MKTLRFQTLQNNENLRLIDSTIHSDQVLVLCDDNIDEDDEDEEGEDNEDDGEMMKIA